MLLYYSASSPSVCGAEGKEIEDETWNKALVGMVKK